MRVDTPKEWTGFTGEAVAVSLAISTAQTQPTPMDIGAVGKGTPSKGGKGAKGRGKRGSQAQQTFTVDFLSRSSCRENHPFVILDFFQIQNGKFFSTLPLLEKPSHVIVQRSYPRRDMRIDCGMLRTTGCVKS